MLAAEQEQCKLLALRLQMTVRLVDWIPHTRSQKYTGLQSLVKCLHHREIVSDTVCSQAKVVLGCAMEDIITVM